MGGGGKLAVVVPVYDGDVDGAFDAMKRWPTTCSVKLRHTDLVLYYADEINANALLRRLPKEASKCFRRTKVVNSHLTEEVRCMIDTQSQAP